MIRLFQSVLLLLALGGSAACQRSGGYGDNTDSGRYYSFRGFKMYAETYGQGTPLLLIHGNGGSISSFYRTIPYFASKYKVIAADSRAHGRSKDYSDSLSFEEMADDCAALLDSMHIDKANVLGWSDGGIVGLLLAIRHPDKILNLASTGANIWPDSTAIVPSAWEDDERYFERNKHTRWITRREKNRWKIFMLDWAQPHVPVTDLARIHCPSLIMSGDHDVITLQHTVTIFQNIPHGYLWIIPNSGHATLIEHSDEFNKKVDGFFSGSF